MPTPLSTLGWDVGGVNVKVARVAAGGVPLAALSWPFEIQRDPAALGGVLASLAAEVEAPEAARHAITMTAELSQFFRVKRDGVAWVLGAFRQAFPAGTLRVYAVDGRFLSIEQALAAPLAVAASNWSATARMVARDEPDALLLDMGSTTTDIIPIVGGRLAAAGLNDPERLQSGELVYSGLIRTPVEAVASQVPWRGASTGVSAEGFALMGDAYLWLGSVEPGDYEAPTPDGRPTTREFARERLARVICADRELTSEAEIDLIARALVEAQLQRIVDAIGRVRARHPAIRRAVVTGLGEAVMTAAALRAGLEPVALSLRLGGAAARIAPAVAVATLLDADPEVA